MRASFLSGFLAGASLCAFAGWKLFLLLTLVYGTLTPDPDAEGLFYVATLSFLVILACICVGGMLAELRETVDTGITIWALRGEIEHLKKSAGESHRAFLEPPQSSPAEVSLMSEQTIP